MKVSTRLFVYFLSLCLILSPIGSAHARSRNRSAGPVKSTRDNLPLARVGTRNTDISAFQFANIVSPAADGSLVLGTISCATTAESPYLLCMVGRTTAPAVDKLKSTLNTGKLDKSLLKETILAVVRSKSSDFGLYATPYGMKKLMRSIKRKRPIRAARRAEYVFYFGNRPAGSLVRITAGKKVRVGSNVMVVPGANVFVAARKNTASPSATKGYETDLIMADGDYGVIIDTQIGILGLNGGVKDAVQRSGWASMDTLNVILDASKDKKITKF